MPTTVYSVTEFKEITGITLKEYAPIVCCNYNTAYLRLRRGLINPYEVKKELNKESDPVFIAKVFDRLNKELQEIRIAQVELNQPTTFMALPIMISTYILYHKGDGEFLTQKQRDTFRLAFTKIKKSCSHVDRIIKQILLEERLETNTKD